MFVNHACHFDIYAIMFISYLQKVGSASKGRRCLGHMAVRFTATYAIRANHLDYYISLY
jgi:hypothetical protein